jgi:Trk-type K+ transport system membrane component
MNRLKRPDVWLLIALAAVTLAGAVLLAGDRATRSDARHLSYSRHNWQSLFDALSAACGVGLLTYDFEADYTPRGRWILTALGVLGALLFVTAIAQALRRVPLVMALSRVPHPLLVGGAFLVFQAIALGVFLLVSAAAGSGDSAADSVWRAVAALASLGWAVEPGDSGAWPVALLAWLGALGWTAWLVVIPPLARRHLCVRNLLAVAGAYSAALLLAALLISAFEAPRGASRRGPPGAALTSQPWPSRYAHSLAQVAAASGAGAPTLDAGASHYPLSDTTAGTKLTLSGLLLIGGLSGSATGGVQWMLLLWALAGGAAAIGLVSRGWEEQHPDARQLMLAGLACCFLLVLLVIVVALGLLLIESWTANAYQPPPALADALLDASSIVAGGNLSTGVVEAITGRNLISGIRQSANLYQFGMGWLMLAMLAGRMLPLIVLCRLASSPACRPTDN